ncbi:membrane protein DedA with SNARE-associated domain [Saccharopolyspora erythraea NRRL 2338]|uniref:Uncharacterized membrane-associated protein-like n=2 Tax=Saccharopolyspora erythraea TaxID=1836 RepID=A4FHG7_SACEN|nr:DedA family protein [Saccharopolyspora erythraea]PFG97187.1 membrane protein DedA with SNARE-associated domain [Saccharopolyspora erythraea NRRL 2338]QRK87388.1 DedA family protein [Saccharopolyspora erythraea]CAM03492.1 uncharacterized membrane-associated protein-like [Saccharopolyspora erythraea NRRL 2338]
MVRTSVPALFASWPDSPAPPGERFGLWAYFLLFVLVLLSSAGVPFIGTVSVGGAAVLAAHGHLDLIPVLVVSVLGSEAGGIVGYGIGARWGRRLLLRPGRGLEKRQKVLTEGERLYAKWGRLAVFVTTAMISGAAKMKFSQFVVWNLITSTAFVLAVGPASYGAGRIVKGDRDSTSIGLLVFGVAVAVVIVWYAVTRRRRRRAAPAPEPGS